jgi:hypothetical protein
VSFFSIHGGMERMERMEGMERVESFFDFERLSNFPPIYSISRIGAR